MPLRLVALTAGLALILAACGGDSSEQTPAPSPSPERATSTPDPAPTPTARPPESTTPAPESTDTPRLEPTLTPEEITDEHVLSLIYWTEIDFWNRFVLFPDTSDTTRDILRAMARDPEERWLPYLVDLAAVPVPYSAFVYRILTEIRPDHPYPIFPITEELGLRTPDDETDLYVEFKHRLIEGIQEDMGAFLDPDKPRLISAQEIFWGGVTVDGIPPLEHPNFITPDEAAAWIGPKDRVIGVEINGDARAYPRRIIDWHEMVNDTIGGVPVSLAYCTLCGSAILYDGRVGDEVYRFGTSGLLYRSNKLMYDRTTNTLWEQFTGEPVWGDLVGSGIQLDVLPVVHTTWDEWLAEHPDTLVLDIETGHARDYGEGVAYARYFASSGLMFPVPDRSGPIAVKDSVYAVRLNDQVVGYPILLLGAEDFLQDEIGGDPVVVFATADRSGGRAYAAPPERVVAYDAETGVATTEDGATWQVTEGALIGPSGEELERLPGHNAFWFALVNHAPRFRLYEPPPDETSRALSGCNLFAYLEGTSIAATPCTL
ncbi:MAG: DUF3179 domain-containing protein [Chloroflexi bacterium]|nr:DUF3179 domain-containing protein [Chloroflexota bacterium]